MTVSLFNQYLSLNIISNVFVLEGSVFVIFVASQTYFHRPQWHSGFSVRDPNQSNVFNESI